ncbi:MAG: polyisoprenoid-binding protein YceI [Planctomycetota bacterium]|jgi:polyisoprenoid-binding protein YceI
MRFSLLIPATLMAAACGVWLAPSAAVAAPSPAAAGRYSIDAKHSSVLFRIKHMDVSWSFGRFAKFSGDFSLDEDLAKCQVSIDIDAASVDTFDSGRDTHIKGTDFLSVKEFPSIKFQSGKVERDGDDYKVHGDLSFHGVTKPVVLEMIKIGEAETKMGQRAGFLGKVTLLRRDFGVETYPNEVLSNEVHLTLSIEGVEH